MTGVKSRLKTQDTIFNVAKVISDASCLEGSVLIQKAPRKEFDDHKKTPNQQTKTDAAICKGEGGRGSAQGLLHPSGFWSRKLCVSK